MPEPIGAVCPYCKQGLDKTPERNKKCPHCQEYIYVRTLPAGDGNKVLVTEDGAKEIDQEWGRVHFRNKWLQTLGQYGISDKDFETHRKKLGERFGRDPGDGDVIWAIFNEVLQKSMTGGDSKDLRLPYFEMALFLYQEGRGFFHILQQSRRMELTRYKQDGFVDNVQVLTAGDASCEACRRLEGRIFTLDEALEQMPIPSEDCTFDFQGTGEPGWCRCLYSAVFD